MTDKELLELAAKAAGIKHKKGDYANGLDTRKGWWNPLTDDGDALRLAVKLSISIISPDNIESVRRGIVRAAAEIGRTSNVSRLRKSICGDVRYRGVNWHGNNGGSVLANSVALGTYQAVASHDYGIRRLNMTDIRKCAQAVVARYDNALEIDTHCDLADPIEALRQALASEPSVDALIAEAVVKEREACAIACEAVGKCTEVEAISNAFASHIRARGQK